MRLEVSYFPSPCLRALDPGPTISECPVAVLGRLRSESSCVGGTRTLYGSLDADLDAPDWLSWIRWKKLFIQRFGGNGKGARAARVFAPLIWKKTISKGMREIRARCCPVDMRPDYTGTPAYGNNTSDKRNVHLRNSSDREFIYIYITNLWSA